MKVWLIQEDGSCGCSGPSVNAVWDDLEAAIESLNPHDNQVFRVDRSLGWSVSVRVGYRDYEVEEFEVHSSSRT